MKQRSRTSRQSPRNQVRFHQLLALAKAGDESAVADLWREFQFIYDEDQP